jgi:hypothetical protein
MVSLLHVTVPTPKGGLMYQTPRLVKFGQFRELTLQSGCQLTAPFTGKDQPTFDSLFPNGVDDGCPARS